MYPPVRALLEAIARAAATTTSSTPTAIIALPPLRFP
jgi:hypothetical protein